MANDADTLNNMDKLQESACQAIIISDEEILNMKEDLQVEQATSHRLRGERSDLWQSLHDVEEKVEELKQKVADSLVPKNIHEETTHKLDRAMRKLGVYAQRMDGHQRQIGVLQQALRTHGVDVRYEVPPTPPW